MSEMFEKVESRVMGKFDSPAELFTYKLGTALKMEKTVLKMLGKLEKEAQRPELKEQFRHHADETRQQIDNVERSFAALGQAPDEKPCPVIDAIEAEGRVQIRRADARLVDAVILGGAAETEHHEIAVYEWLITHADAMGRTDVVARLEENLEQEQHTLEEVKRASQTVAQAL
jgi:ferritin-like metal-binding protein YciE